MLWVALKALPDEDSPRLANGITSLGWWALQFTPKVARVDDALLLELSASERLWGGGARLLRRIYESSKPISVVAYARGATSLVAMARLQASTAPSSSAKAKLPVDQLRPRRPQLTGIDDLPLATLAAARPHLAVLERIGCSRWGQLRALPRDGVARRFGAPLLDALDRAYGLAPELYPWLTLPDVFEAKLELSTQVETAQAMLFGARRLLNQLQLWLQLRHYGVLAIELMWTMDKRRHTATSGELVLRTAEPNADMTHLQRLLGEHLAHITLPAPVLYLRLRSLETQKLQGQSASLLPEALATGDSLQQLLERLSARLGAQQVLQVQTRSDHRPERMQTWQPVTAASRPSAAVAASKGASSLQVSNLKCSAVMPEQKGIQWPAGNLWVSAYAGMTGQFHPAGWQVAMALGQEALYPSWLLSTPLKLVVRAQQPHYGGPLILLTGPQRLETAWWDGAGCALRDYFVARSEQLGLLWIYRERLPGSGAAGPTAAQWYLHGLFA